MQFKRFTFPILAGIMMLFCGVATAQEDASIDPSAIRFWIGEGQNEAVFIVNWNEPDTALAWGYRFDEETITVKNMMEAIAASDSRFGFAASGSMVSDLTFNNGILDLKLSGMYWLFNVNGVMAMDYFDNQMVVDGDYVKWGDESCATDLGDWNYVWTKEVAPVYPLAEDATIAASDVTYWIGEGQNEVVFIVNWNEPNTALAWGYRFEEETVTVKVVMDAIAAADLRFSYEAAGTLVTDLKFVSGNQNLSLAGMYWLLCVNGSMAWYGFEEQTVANCDYIKWGDESCATEIAQWTYVWEKEVEPVSVYNSVNEHQNLAMSVYPNPATSEAWLSVELSGEMTVSVYNLLGQLVCENQIVALEDEPIRIDVSTFDSGVYFVSVSSGRIQQTSRLVVK